MPDTPGSRFRKFMTVWLIMFTGVAVWFGTELRGLSSSNRHRLNEIQQSRIESCKNTYKSFPDMFRPFFPPDPRTWTKKQMGDWGKLQKRATDLTKNCYKQVRS